MVVKAVVNECKVCQSIDLASVCWKKGRLNGSNAWIRLGMDISHYGDIHYLSLRVWSHSLFNLVTVTLVRHCIYYLPTGIAVLWTSPTNFAAHWQWCHILKFMHEWDVWLPFCCPDVPAGNGILERCHGNIKRITTRK